MTDSAPTDDRPRPGGPLAGVRVLDCTHVLAGSYCSALLADMGADVIKIERPGGDESRGLNSSGDGFGPVNRNKRSIVVDLSTSEGAQLLADMSERADVFVQNYRPGVFARRGLGPDDLMARNQRLIYCTISGFGSTGPDTNRGGFDLVAQGIAGVMSVTGEPGGPPVKAGVPIADLNAGTFAALGVVSALFFRAQSGLGQHVDSSLLEGALAYTVWESGIYFATGMVPEPIGSAHRMSAPYEALESADGWINVGAASRSTWEALVRCLGLERLLTDPRFAERADRLSNRAELAVELSAVLRTRPTAAWVEELTMSGVPCGPVYRLDDTWRDPHVLARGMLVEASTPNGPGLFIGPAVKASLTPWAIRRGVASPGADTLQILDEFGVDPARIRHLADDGIVQQADAGVADQPSPRTLDRFPEPQ